ncbi:Glucosamine-6-phosphate isomerase (Glucosamine-6-phosphate deaminase) (GNPDA) (GlcN6P deaminase) [Cryptotrichosporon argae]
MLSFVLTFTGWLSAISVYSLPFTEPSAPFPLPLPIRSTHGSTVLCLAPALTFTLPTNAPADLTAAADRTLTHLWSTKHKHLSPDRGASLLASRCKGYIDEVVLDLTGSNESIYYHATLPTEGRPDAEAYRLSVPVSGPATITAKTALGLFRGLTTFEHLFFRGNVASSARGYYTEQVQQDTSKQVAFINDAINEEESVLYAPHGPYDIQDRPSFGWRAVLLDTSRNFFSVSRILKMVDTMAMVKFSVFHWHITDSNSWPLNIASHSDLARRGAYSAHEIYSEDEVKMIVEYAGERGIDVVVEIDTPGHTAIIAEAYPDYVACYDTRPYIGLAHQPPTGQLRFAEPEVADFTSGIFRSVMNITSSKYFGTGGDEINVKCMMDDEPTASALAINGWSLDDALDDFTKRTHATLLEAGRTPVVWQEMVLDHGAMPSLHKNTVVEIWVNSRDARAVLDQGYRIVHAAGDYFYLDCGQGGWIVKEGGSDSWCDPYKAWTQMYSFDPYNNVTDAQRKLVLGGQTSLWAEQTDETNFDMVLWPRAAAVAELFWTGAGSGTFPRKSHDAIERMHDMRYRMVDRGVGAVPLQPHWCAINPGVCVLGH